MNFRRTAVGLLVILCLLISPVVDGVFPFSALGLPSSQLVAGEIEQISEAWPNVFLHRSTLQLPPGSHAEPSVLEGTVEAKSRNSFQVKLTADPSQVAEGLQFVPFDISLDDRHHGELFDFLILTEKPAAK